MSEIGNFARRVLAEHPEELKPGDTCLVRPDGTVVRVDPSDLQQQLAAANARIAELEQMVKESTLPLSLTWGELVDGLPC
jgi:hypothetical protein